MSNAGPDRHAPQEIDEYLAAQADEFRAVLEQLRAVINAAAPDCTERVSYRIPIFRLKKDFIALSASKSHCGLHTMSKSIPVTMKDELKRPALRLRARLSTLNRASMYQCRWLREWCGHVLMSWRAD